MNKFLEIRKKRNIFHKNTQRLADLLTKTVENVLCERAGQVAPYDDAAIYAEYVSIKTEMSATAESLSLDAAVFALDLFEEWSGKKTYKAGQRVLFNDHLYLVEKDVESPIENWTPDVAHEYYTPVPKAGETGEIDKPIEAVAGMRYVIGKYYIENGALYLCTRQGETEGAEFKLNYLPSALVGHYFEEVAE